MESDVSDQNPRTGSRNEPSRAAEGRPEAGDEAMHVWVIGVTGVDGLVEGVDNPGHLLTADAESVERKRRDDQTHLAELTVLEGALLQMNAEYIASAQEEERSRHEHGAEGHERFDRRLPAFVRQVSPDGGTEAIGAVLQTEQETHLERAQFESPQDFRLQVNGEKSVARRGHDEGHEAEPDQRDAKHVRYGYFFLAFL